MNAQPAHFAAGMTAKENRRWWKQQREMSAAVRHHEAFNIMRLCADLELESDEGGTREDKARAILAQQRK